MRELFNLRYTGKRITQNLWNTLNTHGIRKPARGVRSGCQVKSKYFNTASDTSTTLASTAATVYKRIPVITTSRDENTQRPSYVSKSNLTPIPLFKQTPTLALMNCQSVRNKTSLVMDHILENKVDIAVMTETWLQPGNRDLMVIGELEVPGYTLYHKPRERRGGGVGVLVNSSFKVKVQTCPSYPSFECMRLSISIKSVCVHLLVVYRVPPSTKNKILPTDFIEQFSELLDSLETLKGKFLVAGDFNIHWDKGNDESKERKDLETLLKTYNLIQHVNEPTHTKGHTLDLIITRENDECVFNTTVDELISDHHAIHCNLRCSRPHPEKKITQYRNIKAVEPDKLVNVVSKSIICQNPIENFTNLDELVDQYQHNLSKAIDSVAPIKKKLLVERPMVPWINQDILNSKKQKRKYEKRWRKTRLTIHLQIYQAEKAHMQSLISKAKMNHFKTKIEDCSGNQGKIFKIISHLQNVNSKPTLPDHISVLDLCNTFNEFFVSKIINIRDKLDEIDIPNSLVTSNAFSGETLSHFQEISDEELCEIVKASSNATCETDPLPTKLVKSILLETLLPIIRKIVNLSLRLGKFPDFYKCAHVKPLLKKISLDPDTLKNYRPVSNLTFISKIIEKAISKQLISHFQNHNLIEKFQSAYRPLHSTETALVRVSNDILKAIDEKKCVFLVLLDLSAAFDTIDHSILLQRLRLNLGVDETALQWFSSYLSNRSQCISINGEKSTSKRLPFGVPQGSVLGPLLFSAYMSELGNIVRDFNMNFHSYADDTQIYIAFKPNEKDQTIEDLEQCISKIRIWMVKNKLKLNDDKTEFMLISSPHNKKQLHSLSINIGSEIVNSSSSARNLGVVMDSVLNMEDHITSVCRSCYFHLRNIGAIRKYLDPDTAAQIIHAFITSRLDYCNALLKGLPAYLLHRLTKVQNTAVRIITLCDKKDDITPHLKSLHWLPVPLRIDFKLLLLTYKVLNGLAPSYLSDLLVIKNIPRELRSSSTCNLKIPPSRTVSYGDRAFSIAAPQLWNVLPPEIRAAPTLTLFKTKLKTHLFDQF